MKRGEDIENLDSGQRTLPPIGIEQAKVVDGKQSKQASKH